MIILKHIKYSQVVKTLKIETHYGKNQLLFHVAELFRNEHPEDFEILTKIPATYERIHYKRYYVIYYSTAQSLVSLYTTVQPNL
jgi:hypothetical protein